MNFDQAVSLVFEKVWLPDKELGAVDASQFSGSGPGELAMHSHDMHLKLSLAVSGSEAAVAAVP